jgi:hypothetical protein
MKSMTGRSSLDEENRLYAISAVPFIIISVALALFYLFGHFASQPPQTSVMLDLLWNLVIPGLALAPTAFFLTYEILTSKKEKSTVSHLKRFLGRMAILFIAESSFVAVYLASYFLLAPVISERFAVLSSLLIWLMALTIGLARFKVFFDKLENGKW